MKSIDGPRRCSIEEYQQYFHERQAPDQLVVDETYTLMLLYNRPAVAGADALSTPVACGERAERTGRHGFWLVKLFFIVDENLKRSPQPLRLYMNDSGVTERTRAFKREYPNIKQAYVRAAEEEPGNGLNTIKASRDLSLAKRELVHF